MSESGEGKPRRVARRMATGVLAAAVSIPVIGSIGSGRLNPWRDGVSIVTPGIDLTGKPVNKGQEVEVEFERPMKANGEEVDFIFRFEPDAERGIRYTLQTLIEDGFTFEEARTQLVLGSPYNDPREYLPEETVHGLQKAWGVEGTPRQSYWNFKAGKDGSYYGLWTELAYRNRGGDERKVYTSLNFGRPVQPQPK